MAKEQQWHDISDEVWEFLKPLLPRLEGPQGGITEKDNRRFINGVLWHLRMGAQWRDLPPIYGKWNSVYQRFRRWSDRDDWRELLQALSGKPDFEWLTIDAVQAEVSPHGRKAVSGNQN